MSDVATPLDDERCYRAMQSRDARFDGWFIAGITSTGIYCRPSCPAPVRPKRQNVRIFASAAAAQSAGFRSCKRCRPDATPGSPEWSIRDDLIGRAVRFIEAGEIDRVGVAGLAERLSVSERHLHRLLVEQLGATPIALARAHRGNLARILLETTAMPVTDVAWAAGFSSVRQFNDTVRAIYARTPSELRRAGPASDRPSEPTPLAVRVRLPCRGPLDDDWLLGFLNAHGAPGITCAGPAAHRRTLALHGGPGIVTVEVHDGAWHAHVELTKISDLAEAIAATRRLLDLDADPAWIREHLDGDPTTRRLLANARGIRIPGATDGFAAAIGTIVGQQVSVAGARTLLGRIVTRYGATHGLDETLREFPHAETLAHADLTGLGLTNRRIDTIAALSQRVVDGHLDLGATADRDATTNELLDIPGIGPWTANVIRMRVLGDPDVLLANDLIISRLLGAIDTPSDNHAQWSPWRSYVTTALWAQVGQGEAP